MGEDEIRAYVDAACAMHGFTLDAEERERAILQFARLAAIAAPLLEAPIGTHDEPAPVYRP